MLDSTVVCRRALGCEWGGVSAYAAVGEWGAQKKKKGARTQKEARSFIVSSLGRRLGLVICRDFARHRIRLVPYIGVPRAASSSGACSAASSSGDRRRDRGASAALRAVRRLLPVPGRRGTAGRPRVSAHGRRACRMNTARRTRSAGPVDGATAY